MFSYSLSLQMNVLLDGATELLSPLCSVSEKSDEYEHGTVQLI